jgi:hypothetical protein
MSSWQARDDEGDALPEIRLKRSPPFLECLRFAVFFHSPISAIFASVTVSGADLFASANPKFCTLSYHVSKSYRVVNVAVQISREQLLNIK